MLELGLQSLATNPLLSNVAGEIPPVLLQTMILYLDDPVDHIVEELSVVRDYDQGALVVG